MNKVVIRVGKLVGVLSVPMYFSQQAGWEMSS